MKKTVSIALLVLPFFWTGCGASKHEAVMDEYVALMNEMVDILKTVKDETTAQLATVKLDAMSKRMEAVTGKMSSMQGLSPQEMQDLFKDYQEPMQEVLEQLSRELVRVSAISGIGEEVEQVLAAMNFGGT